MIISEDADRLFEKFCDLYDLNEHVRYYEEDESELLYDELIEELETIKKIIQKKNSGTLSIDDFESLNFSLWMGYVEITNINDDAQYDGECIVIK